MNIKEIIKKRRSVRTFKKGELAVEDLNKVKSFLEKMECDNPFFKADIRYEIIESDEEKLGTYGVIKNGNKYIGVIVDNKNIPLVEVGYYFEKIVLYLTEIGLGTCWIAGTFKREQFDSAFKIKDNELLLIVCPFGYTSDKQSTKEKLFRKLGGFNKRMDRDELFFNESFDMPLELDVDPSYNESLEMVRIAPSAVNKQPWRIVYKDNGYHFFKTKMENPKHPYDISLVDLGIAAYHFYITNKENNLNGLFKKIENIGIDVPENIEYMFSWVKK